MAEIELHPRAFAEMIQAAPLGRFPYAVIYTAAETGNIRIIAVAYASRKPDYWMGRMP